MATITAACEMIETLRDIHRNRTFALLTRLDGRLTTGVMGGKGAEAAIVANSCDTYCCLSNPFCSQE